MLLEACEVLDDMTPVMLETWELLSVVVASELVLVVVPDIADMASESLLILVSAVE